MSALHLAQSEGGLASVADGDRVLVYLILLISLVALGFAALFAKEVLSAGQGTPKMIEIAKAVQEGAAAYLNRQFKTLAVFAALVFFLLFLLPADETSVRVASVMPMKPTSAENTAPTRKKIGRPTRTDVSSAGSRNSRKKTRTAKTARVLNCRLR